MKLLHHTADLWEGRGGYVEDDWVSDDQGPFAFRGRLRGERYVVAALSTEYEAGEDVSFRVEVAKTAAEEDRRIVVRMRDDFFVFDGVGALAKGNVGDPYDDDRKKRGEKWVYVPPSVGARFEDYVDGNDSPVTVDGDAGGF